MGSRWATFDCYGTLIDWDRGIGDALAGLFPGAAAGDLLADYHRIEPLLQAGSAVPYRAVMAEAARAIAEDRGVALAPDAERALPDSLPSWPVFADVPAALEALRAHGWRLAILSNTDPDLLAVSIAAIGVEIDLAITVAEAGSYKPARGHWEAFRARITPDRHVHVAASVFHDLRPCAALGIPCIWINRLGESTEVPHLAELPDLTDLPATLSVFAPD